MNDTNNVFLCKKEQFKHKLKKSLGGLYRCHTLHNFAQSIIGAQLILADAQELGVWYFIRDILILYKRRKNKDHTYKALERLALGYYTGLYISDFVDDLDFPEMKIRVKTGKYNHDRCRLV